MSLYLDLTEFIVNPIRTGIQRVTGELCRHLPSGAAIPVCLHEGHHYALQPALVRAIGDHFQKPSESAAGQISRLGSPAAGSLIEFSGNDVVLIGEVFLSAPRLAFFHQVPEQERQRYRFIVHDLLPLTHPEYFELDPNWEAVFGYFRIVRRAKKCGFVSESTRVAYQDRLERSRSPGGIVLRLGCDALGARVTQPKLNRALEFTVLGTIEPRKNPELILEAFASLVRKVEGLRLTFIGKMGWVNSDFAHKFHAIVANPNSGILFRSGCSDDEIRCYIERSRATIYVSAAEGYGLPPVESLWLGTPVIASSAIPSLKPLGTAGIHYVEPLNAENLQRAVLAFTNDEYANLKTLETAYLDLPTWQSYTTAVLDWCTADAEK